MIERNEILQRAMLMLKVAAKYIKESGTELEIHYDEADCDGHCVAEDCENAADALSELLDKSSL